MHRSTSAYYSGDKDEYLLTGGVFKAQRGFYAHDKTGEVKEADVAGQFFSQASTISELASRNLMQL
jgi:hypothetical protein